MHTYQIMLEGEFNFEIRSGIIWFNVKTGKTHFQELEDFEPRRLWLERYNRLSSTPFRTLQEMRAILGKDGISYFKSDWVARNCPEVKKYRLWKLK